MKEGYLLFWSDFDEKESGVEYLEDTLSIVEYLGEDQMETINELLSRGYWWGEWWHYHLVKLDSE